MITGSQDNFMMNCKVLFSAFRDNGVGFGVSSSGTCR